jgi:hypothetical protein
MKTNEQVDAKVRELGGWYQGDSVKFPSVDAGEAFARWYSGVFGAPELEAPVRRLPEVVAAALAITTDTPENVQHAVASVIAYYREAGYIVSVKQAPSDRDIVTAHRRVPA